MDDMVNNPPHYKLGNLEVEALDVIRAVLSKEEFIGFLRGNIIKYQLRSNKKGKSEDLLKANFYSRKLDIELEYDEV